MKAFLTLLVLFGSFNLYSAEVGQNNTDCVAGFQSGRFQERPAVIVDDSASTTPDISTITK